MAFGGHLLFITPVMFAVYMAMMGGWNRAVKTLSVFQDNEKTEEPAEVKSVPLQNLTQEEENAHLVVKTSKLESVPIKGLEAELLPEEEDLRSVPIYVFDDEPSALGDVRVEVLSQCTVPWDEDRESVGSSVVEFPLAKELDDYPIADKVIA